MKTIDSFKKFIKESSEFSASGKLEQSWIKEKILSTLNKHSSAAKYSFNGKVGSPWKIVKDGHMIAGGIYFENNDLHIGISTQFHSADEKNLMFSMLKKLGREYFIKVEPNTIIFSKFKNMSDIDKMSKSIIMTLKKMISAK